MAVLTAEQSQRKRRPSKRRAAPTESLSTPEPSTTAAAAVHRACWLADDILLLVGSFGVEVSEPLEVASVVGDAAFPIEVRCMSCCGHGAAVAPGSVTVLALRFPRERAATELLEKLLVRTGTGSMTLALPGIRESLTDLQTLIREDLASLDAEVRAELVSFLAAVSRWQPSSGGHLLSQQLFSVREALREQLPLVVVARDQPQNAHVGAILALDERSFYIRGWMRDAESTITRITAVSPEGSRAELLERAFWYPRPDLDRFCGITSPDQPREKLGFLSFFEIDAPSIQDEGWVLEMSNASGGAWEVDVPAVTRDQATVSATLVNDLQHDRLPLDDIVRNHVFPAVSRLQGKRRGSLAVAGIEQFGVPSERSLATVVIPLHEDLVPLEHQLAQFVHDPEVREADLVYVFTARGWSKDHRDQAAELCELYPVPFRIITTDQDICYSRALANEVGARHGRAELLLMLSSQALPANPGWLGRMTSFYHSTPGIGALGAKLLYEDDSIQHAGIHFSRPAGSYLWESVSYFRGFHRHLPAANVPRPVPAVSGECLLVRRDLYLDLGGLRCCYLEGDYQDADFCLRLREEGYENWYMPTAELYHLAESSIPQELRLQTAWYNGWLRTHLWDRQMRELG